MSELVIKKMKIEDICPMDYNPRTISQEALNGLKASIERFGLVEPLIYNERTNHLVGGHQRLKVLKLTEATETDVVVIDIPLTEEKALNITLNNQAIAGVFTDSLQDLLNELKVDIGLEALQELCLDTLMEDPSKGKKDINDIPTDVPSVAQLGDVWLLDKHRVVCGDSTKQETVDRLMNGSKVDMVFTDPPYNVARSGAPTETRTKILNDNVTEEAFYSFLYNFLQLAMPINKGVFYICMGAQELHILRKAFEDTGGHWQNYLIWAKHHFTLSGADYQRQYECILYGWSKDVVNHYFIDNRKLTNIWEDLRDIKTEYDGEYTSIKFQGFEVRIKGEAEGTVRKKQLKTDIWRYDRSSSSKLHPTMKPVELVIEAIKNSTRWKDIVYDPFLGSGSTLIACEETNRVCYGIELEPHYIDVTIKRWEDLTGLTATKVVP